MRGGRAAGRPFLLGELLMSAIRLAGIVRESIVDGPGFRFVVFVQGCPHHCEGCHNPQSHDFAGGSLCETDTLLAEIQKNPLLSGVTFSGGEPFCQPGPLVQLGTEVKKLGLNLIVYSGYTYEELNGMDNPDVHALLELSDYLIDGKFLLEQRNLLLRYRGSDNQRIIDLKRTRELGVVVTAEL